jgi:hypothetical protein
VTQVVADAAEPVRERMRLRLPETQVAEPAVHEEDRRPFSFFFDPEARAVDGDVGHSCSP